MKLLCLGGDSSCARGLQGPHHYLLEEFHHYWDRIDYLCPHHPDAKPTTVFGNVHFHPAPPGRLGRLRWLRETGLRLLGEQSHDLIAAHEYPPFHHGSAARVLTARTGVPHILEIYHVEGHPKAADPGEWFRRILTGLYVEGAARRAAAIRVINRTQVPEWLVRHGVPRNKLRLVYSSYTDFDTFAPSGCDKDIDVLFVGRLVRNKGLAELIESLAGMNEVPRALFVGVGPLRERLEADVRRRGLEDRLVFHGWAEDNREIAGLVNRSRCLVCSSYSEGGPRTTLEAMACGVPVVSTRVGTMPDIINHRVNGCLADFDAPSLRSEIAWLLEDDARARAVGEAGRESIRDFERRKLIREYAESYQALATR